MAKACFQFPAVYTKKLTSVITPTVSLMQDLSQKGISVVHLGSAQMDVYAEDRVFAPKSDVSVIFVSPEWLFGGNDQGPEDVYSRRLCLVAIDEAHLIYNWQDFRESYR